MRKSIVIVVGFIAFLGLSFPAQAHFQMIYTPESALNTGGPIELKLVFTHPFEAGHTMDMGKPEKLMLLHKGKKTDLLDQIAPITWQSLSNQGQAYELSYRLRGMGDYMFCLVPEPYFEKNEGIYMQQITKMMVNLHGLPTDWDSEVGLPAEIVPLDKPYALWEGNVFRGVVKSGGEPVPYAEIEVEYLNHKPIIQENRFDDSAEIKAPQDSFITQTIKSDVNGQFVYGLPEDGWWGFAALGVGPEKDYKGKELSQDAVIWVQAQEMD